MKGLNPDPPVKFTEYISACLSGPCVMFVVVYMDATWFIRGWAFVHGTEADGEGFICQDKGGNERTLLANFLR